MKEKNGLVRSGVASVRNILRELIPRAKELYGDEVQPGDLEPVIIETDISNRTGEYTYKSSYWGRGLRMWHGAPYYGRRYVFPLPLLDETFGKYDVDINFPNKLPADHPVRNFSRFVIGHMASQVSGVSLFVNTLQVSLFEQTDAAWLQTPPTEFHGRLSDLMASVHPEFPYCQVAASADPEPLKG